MRYDLWKKQPPCLFSHILGSRKVLDMLLMPFLSTSLSDLTILRERLVLISYPQPGDQNFPSASHCCVPLLSGAETAIQRTASLPAGLCTCISVGLILPLQACGTNPKLFAHPFTTAFQCPLSR